MAHSTSPPRISRTAHGSSWERRHKSLQSCGGFPVRCLRVDVDAIYLVDEEGDEEFNKSRWYGSDGKTVLDPWDRCPCCPQPRVAAIRDTPAL